MANIIFLESRRVARSWRFQGQQTRKVRVERGITKTARSLTLADARPDSLRQTERNEAEIRLVAGFDGRKPHNFEYG
jgi:hypothetical protein